MWGVGGLGGESSAWIISLYHVNVSAGQQPIHPNKTKDIFIFIILKEEALKLRRGSFSQFSGIFSFFLCTKDLLILLLKL